MQKIQKSVHADQQKEKSGDTSTSIEHPTTNFEVLVNLPPHQYLLTSLYLPPEATSCVVVSLLGLFFTLMAQNPRKFFAIPSSGSADIRRCALHSTPQPCSCWQQSRYNPQSSPTSSRTSRASSALHEISQIGSSVEHINLQCSLYLFSLYRSATKFRLRFDIDL